MLLRCETPSALGAWPYEPVDTKLSRETKATTVLQLATYCDLLGAVQGIAPEHFHVVTPLAEETYRLADFAAYFRFVRSRFQWASSVDPAPPRALVANDILVVAPYNAQVSALRTRLAALGVERVGTVDKFQGQEAPVVIYSCTSSSPEDAPRGMAFLYDPHRFNVATSRAQGVVIVVASPRLFEAECRTPEQMRWANGLCRYREMAKIIAA